ncbi:hypothetical protein T265_11273 [Opisthorchis viverrini]|uniref:RRM domain-containing protein n=1 Tax=Opisthorchis viverrini TaxID=6198 RepID=A0A074YZ80_OPIVI|nr:hypothetical protein T265_11273 [Opisthorchis viverrini]KER20101.1 hypothetical protein T265_11273 [Opisthorchis viverrini]
MSKKSRKGLSVVPKVCAKPKTKKTKNKAKKLAAGVKLQASKPLSGQGQVLSEPGPKQKKQRKNKRNDDAIHVHQRDLKVSAKSKASFGAVSSDSEPELINPQWHLGDHPGKTRNKGHGTKSSSSDGEHSVLDPSAEGAQSSDLDVSESDIDEELDESELNSLLLNKTDGSTGGSSEEEEFERSEEKPNSLEPQPVKKKEDEKTKSKVPKTHTTAAVDVSSVQESPLSLNNPAELLKEIERRSVDLASRSLYVAPVPANCSLDLLKQLSPSALACRLSYNTHSKTCRKYAFLEYGDSQSATAARKSLMGRLFAGRTVNTQPGRPQYLATQGSECVEWKRLFITGLHQTTTKADLQQMFPKAQEVDYPFHARGHPLGYALVKFVNEDVAFEAFVNTHKRVIKGQTICVNYVINANKNAKADKTGPSSLPTTVELSVPSKHIPELKRPVTSSSDLGPATKRPKVLIQPIQEAIPDAEDSPIPSNVLSEGLDLDSDDFLIRPASSKAVVNSKPSHILSQLVHSRKAALSEKSKAIPGKEESNKAEDDEDEDLGSEGTGSDDTSDSDSCESLAGDSTDPDSATLSEDDDDDDDKQEEEEEDIGDDEPEDTEKEGLSNGLFQCPPSAEEQAALEASEDSLGEEVDNVLGEVMHARRSAMRALKNAGSSKRAWSASGTSKGQKIQRGNKGFKPFMLPIPSKRN